MPLVQNAVKFLKMIGTLDENENLKHIGKFLSVLPGDPTLGKMQNYGCYISLLFPCIDNCGWSLHQG
ncbi:hypothetical protein BUALT_Bualt14G0034300 [Buddleja alternifolia]|uniref:Uncharacterized protein n=1 Tax=Buddleja alternifolia TaxID=168488 RepID=A0AAV6WMS8_9LAMI|nr:hypothetical protein BUALT_Bualt14G0034300 [Buddleja alternifolia]